MTAKIRKISGDLKELRAISHSSALYNRAIKRRLRRMERRLRRQIQMEEV